MTAKRKQHILFLTLGILAAGLLFALLAKAGLQISCPFHLITGWNCPGCGNSRAAIALLRLDFMGMLHYNLLFPLQMLYIVRIYIVCAKNYIAGKRFAYHSRPDWLDIVTLILVLVWTILRNLTPLH